jgi:hypothetical protein
MESIINYCLIENREEIIVCYCGCGQTPKGKGMFVHGHNTKVDWCNSEYRTLKTKNMSDSVQKRWSDPVYREKHVKSYFDATILRYEDPVWKEFHSKRCKEGGQKRKENPENALKSKLNFKKATERQQYLRKNDSKWVDMFSKSMSDSWKDPEVRERRVKGLSTASIKRYTNPKNRRKASELRTTALIEGRGYKKIKHFYSNKNKKELYYHSSYELQAFNILEQLSVVKCYDRFRHTIDYEFEGRIRKTIPDILVTYQDGSQEIIEIKSEWRVDTPINIAKFQAISKYALENKMKFSVFSEKHLFIDGKVKKGSNLFFN